MFTGFFSVRLRSRGDPRTFARHCLRRLLQSRVMHPHRFRCNCEIGPFIVEYVCRERSLIVELQERPPRQSQQTARAALLAEMGYTVLHVSAEELLARPHRAVTRLRHALVHGAAQGEGEPRGRG